jgi:hypothetical protein
MYSNYKKISNENARGEIEVKITIQIPPEHPVLDCIQDLIQKSGCSLSNLSNPGDEVSVLFDNFNVQNASITFKGDSKSLSVATRNISDAIIRVERGGPVHQSAN